MKKTGRKRETRFNTYASCTSDIGETKSRLLAAIRNVVRLGFTLRHFVVFNMRWRHGYLILHLCLLFHVADGARHKSIDRSQRQIRNTNILTI